MRLIDADALINNKFKNDISYKAFCSLIKRQPTIEPQQRWIPCSERLPEPQTEVVVSFDNGEVKILWQDWAVPSSLGNYPGEPLAYIGGDGIPHTYEEWESMKTYAVAWMPLPEPYKGEQS